ncbi:MBL fold metallo-hydrolase [Holdemania filiformis]|uniref:MBL fold metallo-hydrolase n=1 Tax=Holdemania filiformis TaxID=61171 RepID=UPI00210D1967|nr:MBL fold metallo-hydrolase [Holdemania filiformis]MCQ4952135.1 MBL fold metallo-hydrolase [Holdemania filiformis]
MEFRCLASSSAGNCYHITLNRKDLPPVVLLLEAGLPYAELLRRMTSEGLDLRAVDAVLITHNHKDHCAAFGDLRRRGKRVYGNRLIVGENQSTLLEAGRIKTLAAETRVYPFAVEHDAEDSLGFVIYTDMEMILFVNDCKYFAEDLSKQKFNYIFIESNYDGQVIHFAYEAAKEQHNEVDIKRYERILNSHMSIKHTCDQLKKLDLSNCKGIFLMHLSDRHANPNLFKQRVSKEFGKPCFVCRKSGGIL